MIFKYFSLRSATSARGVRFSDELFDDPGVRNQPYLSVEEQGLAKGTNVEWSVGSKLVVTGNADSIKHEMSLPRIARQVCKAKDWCPASPEEQLARQAEGPL